MMPDTQPKRVARCEAVVIWIDWYAYHVARFVGLQSAFGTNGEIVGIELVGGVGVHEGLKFRESLPEGLPIETLLPESDWKNANKLALARALWAKLNELDPQVVLVPGYYTLPALAAAQWARQHGRISVLMTESTEADHARSAWKEKLKSTLIRRMFDWAVTGGAAHVRYLHALHFPKDRIASFYDVVGNEQLRDGVTALRAATTAALHSLPEEYLLYVGRLAPEKNVDGLLHAWAEYRRRGGQRPLVLVGAGESTTSLQQLAQESGFADHVYFAGHKGSRELWPYFAFASAFILPSTREPWGLVVNEAMAAGLPVFVSSRCGCAENLVAPGENGYLFDPSAFGELTEHLLAFDGLSSADRADMAAASSRRIAEYSPNNFGTQIAQIAREKRGNPVDRSNGSETAAPSFASVEASRTRAGGTRA